LFEDNAEFGLGMRLALNARNARAKQLLTELAGEIGDRLVSEILNADQSTEEGIKKQRARIDELKKTLQNISDTKAKELLQIADDLVKKSIWIVGGDGWAYDIGYGGLDHVLATGENVNVLVLDTEVYSNTGGQASKATPLGAAARFAAAGKPTGKKDLALMAVTYGNIYVARIAMGANPTQAIKAFHEAESYEGASLIIAYSHCISHGFDLKRGAEHQKMAVDSGQWILFRYDPRLKDEGKAFQLDCKEPSQPLKDYLLSESRFAMLHRDFPERAEKLLKEAEAFNKERWALYKGLSEVLNRK
jgi:pyruvate-ferredoxin/flavodoxin oxidoreductase